MIYITALSSTARSFVFCLVYKLTKVYYAGGSNVYLSISLRRIAYGTAIRRRPDIQTLPDGRNLECFF